MNTRFLRLALASIGLSFALNASAHDPKEHEKEAAAAKVGPDCAKLKTMDTSKMDPNDPVMKAMMTKCAKSDAAAGAAHHHDEVHVPAKDAAKDQKKDAGDASATTDDHGGHR